MVIIEAPPIVIITIIAIIGMATPTIANSAFANKGGDPNDNAGLNPFKSCDKHDNKQKKCEYKPTNGDGDCVDTEEEICDGGDPGSGEDGGDGGD